MKRILILLTLLPIIALSSCSKNEDSDDQLSLVGGYYSGFGYSSSIIGNSYDVYWSYRFIDGHNVERTANENNPYGSIIGEVDKCTYEYNHPYIIIKTATGKEQQGQFITEDVFRIYDTNYKRQ